MSAAKLSSVLVCSLPAPKSRRSRCPTPTQRQVTRSVYKSSVNAWTLYWTNSCVSAAVTIKTNYFWKPWKRGNRTETVISGTTSLSGRTIPTNSQTPATIQNEACTTNTSPNTKTTTPNPLNRVCLVIDLEDFFTGRQFLPREFGWCDHTGKHYSSIHYKPCVPWPNLSAKDQRTAYHCTKYVHSLPYYPRESYHVASELLVDVRCLYQCYKTPERFMVAHKGGIEGTCFTTWKIPHLDLKTLACPKFDDLQRLSSVGSCGQLEHPLQLHCLKWSATTLYNGYAVKDDWHIIPATSIMNGLRDF